MRRLVLAAVLCVIAVSCGGPPLDPDLPDRPTMMPARLRVRFLDRGEPVTRDVPLDEYVRTTVLSEVAPAGGSPTTVDRMLEVQAIISRTWAVAHVGRHRQEGFDLCATTHCQLFDPRRVETSRWSDAAADAVRRTPGTILVYRGRPAQALYHADCGGHTSAAAAVWGGSDRAYLVARRDDGPADDAHAPWTYRASAAAIERALDEDRRVRLDERLDGIDVTDRDAAGRAVRVTIRSGARSHTIRGEDLRAVLSRAFGARAIRSTRFTVTRNGSDFTFEGRGFGHGVGLCQAGAYARLKAGARLKEVIGFYYPGATVERVRAGLP
jgi:stage II sporulation protein D